MQRAVLEVQTPLRVWWELGRIRRRCSSFQGRVNFHRLSSTLGFRAFGSSEHSKSTLSRWSNPSPSTQHLSMTRNEFDIIWKKPVLLPFRADLALFFSIFLW